MYNVPGISSYKYTRITCNLKKKKKNNNLFPFVHFNLPKLTHNRIMEVTKGNKKKWEGKARADLKSVEPRHVWPLLEDFFGLDKWFPTLSVCLPVEGEPGRPGSVRFCAGFKTPVDEKMKTSSSTTVNWTKQKLLSIDPAEMVFTYAIVDGNVGFDAYVATWRVVGSKDGCAIEWCYEVDPVQGWESRDLDEFVRVGLSGMAAKMELALRDYFEVTREFAN